MKLWQCDRCGLRTISGENITEVRTSNIHEDDTHTDLCVGCRTEFRSFLRGLPIPGHIKAAS